HRIYQDRQLASVYSNRHLLAHAHLVGQNIHFPTVHRNVAVAHQLPRLAAGNPETKAIHHIVQTPLELLQQHSAGHAFGARRLLEIIAELPFLREVNAFGFLLLPQLQTVAYDFSLAVFPVLSGSKVALLDGTFVAEAFRAFEEQLHSLAAAETANCIFVTCQVSSPS